MVNSNRFSLNILKIDRDNIENKNVIKKHSVKVLTASISFFGNMIATSYFPLATIPKIEQILIYSPYTPNCSGEKYCVKIGSIMIGIN